MQSHLRETILLVFGILEAYISNPVTVCIWAPLSCEQLLGNHQDYSQHVFAGWQLSNPIFEFTPLDFVKVLIAFNMLKFWAVAIP